MNLKVTLDQWLVFHSIIDEGGFAQAAQALHRSQSSISYAVRKLQELLGVELFRIEGRKAVLTEAGMLLQDRSRQLIENAGELEAVARRLKSGWEPNIRVAMENLLPTEILLDTLQRFEPVSRGTRVHLREEILSGVSDALEQRQVDLAITPMTPAGYLYENLMDVEFLAVAHRNHALHRDNSEEYGVERLRDAVHIVIRDSGSHAEDAGWIQHEQKWTVSSFTAALDIVANGMGFAWLPRHNMQPLLDQGVLKPLRLRTGSHYRVPVNIVYGQQQEVGPAARVFVDMLKDVIKQRVQV